MYGKSSLILLLLFAIACNYSDKPIEVEKEGIQISIPGYMEEDELAEDGIVEYANRYRNFYLVVVSDEGRNMDSVLNRSVKRLTTELEDVKTDTVTQDSTGIEVHIVGKFYKEKLPIHYFHKIIKSENDFKILTVWTRGDEREEKYRADIQAIMNSFKSIK